MARTPKNSPRTSRASPATVGKITKKNNNSIANVKVETDASKSIVSSICTPRRMTRSFAKVKHEEMPPPTSPLHTKKRKPNTSTKKSTSAVKQENEAKKMIGKGRKTMKLFAENVAAESDSQNKTPIVKIESHTDAELVENKPLAQQSSGKKGRKSKSPSNKANEAEPKLNTTFEMDPENEEYNKETDLPSAGKHAALINRISVIDLTESPMAKTASPLNATFSPLANILEESEVKLSDETFTEEKETEPNVQIIKSGLTPKLAKKVTPNSSSAKKAAPQLKRLQVKAPMKTISETKSQTPINGILKQKPMSSAKKAKVLEAVKVVIKENVTIEPNGSAKKTPLKIGGNDAQKSSPFRFGATETKSRGFNFKLVGSKIPTWKELEKQNDQGKYVKLGRFTYGVNNNTISVGLK